MVSRQPSHVIRELLPAGVGIVVTVERDSWVISRRDELSVLLERVIPVCCCALEHTRDNPTPGIRCFPTLFVQERHIVGTRSEAPSVVSDNQAARNKPRLDPVQSQSRSGLIHDPCSIEVEHVLRRRLILALGRLAEHPRDYTVVCLGEERDHTRHVGASLLGRHQHVLELINGEQGGLLRPPTQPLSQGLRSHIIWDQVLVALTLRDVVEDALCHVQ